MLRGVIPLATRRVGGGLGAASRTARLPRFSAWLLVDCALGQKPLARSPVAARFPAYAGLAHLSAIRFNTGGRSEAPGVVRAVPGAVGEWDVEGGEEQLEDVGYKSIPEPKKVFVGNVSWNSTVRELGLHFEEACGEVEDVYVPQDRDGRPKGIAFVTFADPASASKAVKTLHEVEFDGRPLVVEIAQTSERRREPRESSGR
jgi:hypothetical protein